MNFFFELWEWNSFTNMTHSKNSSLLNLFIWLKELNTFSGIWLNGLNFFSIRLKELNRVSKWHKELNPFLNMTHRNFSELQLKEFFLIKYASQNSKNWTFFSQISRRIELFEKHDSQNWTIFHVTHGIEPLLSNMSHRNWIFLFYMTQWIEPFFFFWIWLKELNFFFLNFDAKNWTFFLDMTQRIDPYLLNFDTNQRIEPFQKWLKEFNFLLELCLKEFFYLKKWLEEMIFFNWLQNWTFLNDSNFSIWLKELNFLFDSKNWTFFFLIVTQNFNFLKWLEELRPFLILTQRIEPSLWIWLKERTFFFFDMPTRIEPFLKNFTSRIEFCKKYDTKNWTLSSFFFFWRNLTQRFDFFKLRTLLQKYDSKNWFLFFFFWTLSMELFYKFGLLQEFNPFEPFHMIQRIGPILHDSKNWTFFLHDSKNWTLFSVTQRSELFSPTDSKNWTLLNYYSKNWIFFFMTRRIEPFF